MFSLIFETVVGVLGNIDCLAALSTQNPMGQGDHSIVINKIQPFGKKGIVFTAFLT